MKYTVIYNMNKDDFFKVKVPTIDEMIGSDDYWILGDIEATDIEDAFYILNCEHPTHIIEKVRTIASNATTDLNWIHTSMSVGDILVEENGETYTYWFCERIGWKEMK